MSNLNRHVKKDKIKWIAVTIAILLIAAALVGMCLQLFGNGKQKPSEWFKKPDNQIEQVDKQQDTTEGETNSPETPATDQPAAE